MLSPQQIMEGRLKGTPKKGRACYIYIFVLECNIYNDLQTK